MLGLWQAGGPAPAYQPRVVQVSSFGELQQHVDAAAGPTVLLVRAAKPLAAAKTLVVSKADIVITAAEPYDPDGEFKGRRIAVRCDGVKTLVDIR